MRKLVYIFIGALLALSGSVFAATTLFPTGGGTGISTATIGDVGDCLTVLDNDPFTWSIEPCSGAAQESTWTVTTIGGQDYLTPTTTNYTLSTRSNGFITHGSSTAASTFNVTGVLNASSTAHITGNTTITGTLITNDLGSGTSTASFGSTARKSCFTTYASDGTQLFTVWDENGVQYTRLGSC